MRESRERAGRRADLLATQVGPVSALSGRQGNKRLGFQLSPSMKPHVLDFVGAAITIRVDTRWRSVRSCPDAEHDSPPGRFARGRGRRCLRLALRRWDRGKSTMVVVGLARRARLLFSRFLRMSILLCLALVGYGLVREPHWQNAIRRAMGCRRCRRVRCAPIAVLWFQAMKPGYRNVAHMLRPSL